MMRRWLFAPAAASQGAALAQSKRFASWKPVKNVLIKGVAAQRRLDRLLETGELQAKKAVQSALHIKKDKRHHLSIEALGRLSRDAVKLRRRIEEATLAVEKDSLALDALTGKDGKLLGANKAAYAFWDYVSFLGYRCDESLFHVQQHWKLHLDRKQRTKHVQRAKFYSARRSKQVSMEAESLPKAEAHVLKHEQEGVGWRAEKVMAVTIDCLNFEKYYSTDLSDLDADYADVSDSKLSELPTHFEEYSTVLQEESTLRSPPGGKKSAPGWHRKPLISACTCAREDGGETDTLCSACAVSKNSLHPYSPSSGSPCEGERSYNSDRSLGKTVPQVFPGSLASETGDTSRTLTPSGNPAFFHLDPLSTPEQPPSGSASPASTAAEAAGGRRPVCKAPRSGTYSPPFHQFSVCSAGAASRRSSSAASSGRGAADRGLAWAQPPPDAIGSAAPCSARVAEPSHRLATTQRGAEGMSRPSPIGSPEAFSSPPPPPPQAHSAALAYTCSNHAPVVSTGQAGPASQRLVAASPSGRPAAATTPDRPHPSPPCCEPCPDLPDLRLRGTRRNPAAAAPRQGGDVTNAFSAEGGRRSAQSAAGPRTPSPGGDGEGYSETYSADPHVFAEGAEGSPGGGESTAAADDSIDHRAADEQWERQLQREEEEEEEERRRRRSSAAPVADEGEEEEEQPLDYLQREQQRHIESFELLQQGATRRQYQQQLQQHIESFELLQQGGTRQQQLQQPIESFELLQQQGDTRQQLQQQQQQQGTWTDLFVFDPIAGDSPGYDEPAPADGRRDAQHPAPMPLLPSIPAAQLLSSDPSNAVHLMLAPGCQRAAAAAVRQPVDGAASSFAPPSSFPADHPLWPPAPNNGGILQARVQPLAEGSRFAAPSCTFAGAPGDGMPRFPHAGDARVGSLRQPGGAGGGAMAARSFDGELGSSNNNNNNNNNFDGCNVNGVGGSYFGVPAPADDALRRSIDARAGGAESAALGGLFADPARRLALAHDADGIPGRSVEGLPGAFSYGNRVGVSAGPDGMARRSLEGLPAAIPAGFHINNNHVDMNGARDGMTRRSLEAAGGGGSSYVPAGFHSNTNDRNHIDVNAAPDGMTRRSLEAVGGFQNNMNNNNNPIDLNAAPDGMTRRSLEIVGGFHNNNNPVDLNAAPDGMTRRSLEAVGGFHNNNNNPLDLNAAPDGMTRRSLEAVGGFHNNNNPVDLNAVPDGMTRRSLEAVGGFHNNNNNPVDLNAVPDGMTRRSLEALGMPSSPQAADAARRHAAADRPPGASRQGSAEDAHQLHQYNHAAQQQLQGGGGYPGDAGQSMHYAGEIQRLNRALEDLREKHASDRSATEREAAGLREQLAAAESQNAVLSTRMQQLRGELEGEAARAKAEAAALADELAKARQELHAAQSDAVAQSRELKAAADAGGKKDKLIQSSGAELDRLRGELRVQQEAVHKADVAANRLQMDMRGAQEAVRAEQVAVREKEKEAAEARKKYQAARQTVNELEVKTTKLEHALAEVTHDHSNGQKALAKAQQRADTAQQTHVDLDRKYQNLLLESKQADRKAQGAAQEVKRLTQQVAALESRLKADAQNGGKKANAHGGEAQRSHQPQPAAGLEHEFAAPARAGGPAAANRHEVNLMAVPDGVTRRTLNAAAHNQNQNEFDEENEFAQQQHFNHADPHLQRHYQQQQLQQQQHGHHYANAGHPQPGDVDPWAPSTNELQVLQKVLSHYAGPPHPQAAEGGGSYQQQLQHQQQLQQQAIAMGQSWDAAPQQQHHQGYHQPALYDSPPDTAEGMHDELCDEPHGHHEAGYPPNLAQFEPVPQYDHHQQPHQYPSTSPPKPNATVTRGHLGGGLSGLAGFGVAAPAAAAPHALQPHDQQGGQRPDAQHSIQWLEDTLVALQHEKSLKEDEMAKLGQTKAKSIADRKHRMQTEQYLAQLEKEVNQYKSELRKVTQPHDQQGGQRPDAQQSIQWLEDTLVALQHEKSLKEDETAKLGQTKAKLIADRKHWMQTEQYLAQLEKEVYQYKSELRKVTQIRR
ncbi:hypothetical protein DIPPA_00660 [Diplonema papillatum]|nr:hypothetical protein DIPPA_00660 [Diplonema papillatum]